MQTGPHSRVRRVLLLAAAGLLGMALTACTARGGGQLPPDNVVFKGAASLGFSFSCQDSGGLNPPTGRLHIELAYGDKGTNPLGGAFEVHGIVDEVDPVLESEICIGQNPPPGGNELMFLGRYSLTSSSAPAGFPATCQTHQNTTEPTCRFEVIVRDNDTNRVPSKGDYFHIALSSATAVSSQLEPTTVFYTRGGLLSSGNLTVD